MKANEIIDLIITRHENNDPEPVYIHDELRLEPRLDYKGKMAVDAYRGFYRGTPAWNGLKKYCGVLDFRIMDSTGKMRHQDLIKRTIEKISVNDLKHIYDGGNPNELDLSHQKIALLSDIQCSFLEQEVNWGPEDFQLRTYFGCDTLQSNLKNAVPRDFLTIFFIKMSEELNSGKNLDETYNDVIRPHLNSTNEARSNTVILPPKNKSGIKTEIDKKFSKILEDLTNKKPKRWITPFVDRIKIFCETIGPSRHYERNLDFRSSRS